MEGSWWALVGFLGVSVAVAAVMLWPRFRESISANDPVVVEAVDAFRRSLHGCEGPVARQALDADVTDLRRDRHEWHARLRGEGVDEAVHVALDRL